MILFAHPDAQREIDEAAATCEAARPGYGRKFVEAVDRVVQLAAVSPSGYARVTVPRVSREFRRILVNGFPYTVYYEVIGGDIAVFAVSHQKRRPLYWRRRLSP